MEIERRKVRVTIELDVSEGPRMRRHRRNREDFRTLVGNPLIDYAEQLLAKEFGLVANAASDARVEYFTAHVEARAMPEGTPLLTQHELENGAELVGAGWRQVGNPATGFLKME